VEGRTTTTKKNSAEAALQINLIRISRIDT